MASPALSEVQVADLFLCIKFISRAWQVSPRPGEIQVRSYEIVGKGEQNQTYFAIIAAFFAAGGYLSDIFL